MKKSQLLSFALVPLMLGCELDNDFGKVLTTPTLTPTTNQTHTATVTSTSTVTSTVTQPSEPTITVTTTLTTTPLTSTATATATMTQTSEPTQPTTATAIPATSTATATATSTATQNPTSVEVVLQPPTGLSATRSSDTSVYLSWHAVEGAVQYQLYRNGNVISDVVGTSYLDEAVLAQSSYQYWLVAENAAGDKSANSNHVVLAAVEPDDVTSNDYININFQTVNAPVPAGYEVDFGEAFKLHDNGLQYGWSSDVSKGGRDRGNSAAKDQRFDTLVHMQLAAENYDASWSIGLANGDYRVRLVAADSGYCLQDVSIKAEGVSIIDYQGSCVNSTEGTQVVTVSDGELSITRDRDSLDNKLGFIEISKETGLPDSTPPASIVSAQVTSGDQQLIVAFEPPLFDFAGTLLTVASQTNSSAPQAGQSYQTGETLGNATVVSSGERTQQFISNLSNDQTYVIRLFSYDANYNYAPALEISGIPRSMVGDAAKLATQTSMELLEQGNSPETVYQIFNQFAKTHFGAEKTPILYDEFGDELTISADSTWSHISRYSAVFSWQTNLPAMTYVQYSQDQSFAMQSAQAERPFYQHLHYLRDLTDNTQYFYRFVSIDERGNELISEVASFTTGLQGEVIEISSALGEPPYVLDQANVTYLITEDLLADSGLLSIKAAPITIDLGGHTLVHQNADIATVDVNDMASNGVAIHLNNTIKLEGKLTIVNGTIAQGEGDNMSTSYGGLNAIYLNNQTDLEVAGVSVHYHTPQGYGMMFRYAKGEYNIHHNVFLDSGSSIPNRHGASGGRSIYFVYPETGVNQYQAHHNLIKRTRQNGLSKFQQVRNNEIYVDSWSTNAFAIQPNSLEGIDAGDIVQNKVFLTGYHAIGISWAHEALNVSQNLIHMEGVNTERRRWYESFGDQNSLNGLRVTNYSPGGQIRNNLHYVDNVILGTARHGSIMRGTEIFSDLSIAGTIVGENYIEIMAEDAQTQRASSIVVQGLTKNTDLPILYRGNELVSNLTNISFGDDYGRGHNALFVDTLLRRTGDHANYHTIVFDGGYSTNGHIIRDAIVEGGAALDDVYWKRCGNISAYSIEWTQTITGAANADVSIWDINQQLVYQGQLDANGELAVPLTQMTIRPVEWDESATGAGVRDLYNHQKIVATPHQIRVGGTTKQVTVDKKQTLVF